VIALRHGAVVRCVHAKTGDDTMRTAGEEKRTGGCRGDRCGRTRRGPARAGPRGSLLDADYLVRTTTESQPSIG
jgi:hypothetical protein